MLVLTPKLDEKILLSTDSGEWATITPFMRHGEMVFGFEAQWTTQITREKIQGNGKVGKEKR